MPLHGRSYPYDIVVSDSGLMLEVDRGTGNLLWNEERIPDLVPPVQLTELDRAYAQYPPSVEYPYAVNDLSDGYGIHTQSVDHRKRYWYGEYVDCTTGSPVCGPLPNAIAAVQATSISQFIEFNGVLYFAHGRYLSKYNASGASPTQVHDFGGGAVIGQMAVFQGTQSAPFLFIPLGSGTVYYVLASDGTTFTAHGTRQAMGFCVVGQQLWLYNKESNQYVIRKATDGGTAATWGAVTIIGDSTYPINWMVTAADRLFPIKTDGVFAPTTNGPSTLIDQDLTPSMRQYAMANNGVNAINWNEDIVFPFGNGLWNYSPYNGQLKQFGPELIEENLSPVKGVVKAIAAQAGICMWAGLYDATANASYLVRYGAWDQQEGTAGPVRIFKPAWHGHFYKWASKTVTAMLVTNLYTVNSIVQPHLFVGFSDGTSTRFILSRFMSAYDDPNYQFNTANDGVVYYPRYTANMPSDTKLLRACGVYGHNLASSNRTLTPAYKVPIAGSYTAFSSAAVAIDPGDRVSLATPQFSNAFDAKVTLHAGATSGSPVLEAFVLYSAIRSIPLKKIRATVRVATGVQDRRGIPTRKSWQDIRALVEQVGSTNNEITLINPAGESITVMCTGYGHQLIGVDKETGDPRYSSYLELVQTSSPVTKGTWQRASAYTWADLSGLTWSQVALI